MNKERRRVGEEPRSLKGASGEVPENERTALFFKGGLKGQYFKPTAPGNSF